jgi:MFS family permease
MILSTAWSASVFGRILLAFLSQRVGTWSILRSFIATAMALQFSCPILYVFAPNLSWFYLIAFVYGLVGAFWDPAGFAFASCSSSGRGARVGVFYSVVAAGLATGPLLATLLALHFSYDLIMLLSTFLPLLGLAFVAKWRTFERSMGTPKTGIQEFRSSIARVAKNTNVRLILFGQLSWGLTAGIFLALFPVYVYQQLHYASYVIPALFTIRGITNVLVRVPAGNMCDLRGRRIVYVQGLALTAIVFAILSLTGNAEAIGSAMLIYGVAWGFRMVSSSTLLADSVLKYDLALASSFYFSALDGGFALGGLLAAAASLWLPVHIVFAVSSIVMVFTTLVVFLWTKELYARPVGYPWFALMKALFSVR